MNMARVLWLTAIAWGGTAFGTRLILLWLGAFPDLYTPEVSTWNELVARFGS